MKRSKGKTFDHAYVYATTLKSGGRQKRNGVELFYENGSYRIKYRHSHFIRSIDRFMPSVIVSDLGNDYYLAQRVFNNLSSR